MLYLFYDSGLGTRTRVPIFVNNMAGVELIVGYDCAFVDPLPKLIQSECAVCLLVLREPHLISCCGHNFCRSCVDQIIKNKKPCPLCQQCAFTTLHNKGLERSLKELVVTCEKSSLGCDWRGELGKLDAHLSETCPCVELRCRYASCNVVSKRRDMALHETTCKFRPFRCEHCTTYATTFDDVVNTHWPACPQYPVPCPSKCGAVVERQHLQRHIGDECPLTSVPCEFSYAGCRVNAPRKDIQAHLSADSLLHLSMVNKLNSQLMSDYCKLLDKVAVLEVSAAEQRAKIKDLEIKVFHNNLFPVRIDINTAPAGGKPVNNNALMGHCDFYSHFGGYKMQLQVRARGSNLYAPSFYLSVHMMRGEYDAHLQWPFNGTVVVSVNEGKRHVIDFRNAAANIKSRVLQGVVAEFGHGPPEPVYQWNVFFVQPICLQITVESVTVHVCI